MGDVRVRIELIVCAVRRSVGRWMRPGCADLVTCGEVMLWHMKKCSEAVRLEGDSGDGA